VTIHPAALSRGSDLAARLSAAVRPRLALIATSHGPAAPIAPARLAASLLGVALFLALPAAARAQFTPDAGILDGVVRAYQDTSASWLGLIQPLAQRTFAILAALELAVSGIFWAVGRDGLDAVAVALLRKFILLAILFSLLSLLPLWLPSLTAGFEAAGQAASGTTAVNPSQILALGSTIASRMLLSLGVFGLLVNPVGVLVGTFTAYFVILAFCLIAAQLCLTLVETYLVISGGALFLGFAGFRGTAPLAEGYLAYAFQVGAKIYLLYLLLGVGTGLAQQWAMLDFSPGGNPGAPSLLNHFQVLCGAIVFCLLVWYIPRTIASRLVQGLSFHLAAALR
jgi:type IV secretion system protein TrbL